MLVLRALGRLQLIDENGADRAPGGQKARGLIALLAMSPDFTRSRSWLQDKLWSDRGSTQAAASLRQALSEIRKAFGPERDILQTSRTSVSLDATLFRVSFEAPPSPTRLVDSVELFEDLEIQDREFEHWIRDQRLAVGQAFSSKLNKISASTITFFVHLSMIEDYSLLTTRFVALAAKSLRGHLEVRIVERSIPPGVRGPLLGDSEPGVAVHLQMHSGSGLVRFNVGVADAVTSQVYWNSEFTGEWPFFALSETPQFIGLVSQTVDAVLAAMAACSGERSDKDGAVALFNSSRLLTFALDKNSLAEADQLISKAFELDPRGRYLAWRAMIRTIARFQHITGDPSIEGPDVAHLSAKAIEKSPEDSLVLSVRAHSEYLFGEGLHGALHLAELALDADPLNPLAWAALSNLQLASGANLAALKSAERAIDLSSRSRAAHFLRFYGCMAAAGSGDYHLAIEYGRTAALLSPSFVAPRRYLVALYAATGQRSELAKAVNDLKSLEPTFTPRRLLEATYPVNTLRRLPLIDLVEKIVSDWD